MKNEFDLEKLKEDGRRIFLAEQTDRLPIVIDILFNLRLNEKKEDLKEIKRFFHTLKGTSGIFDYFELGRIGSKYEAFLKDFNSNSAYSHKFFSVILEGFAEVKKELNILSSNTKSVNKLESYKVVRSEKNYEQEIELPLEYVLKVSCGRILVVDDDLAILNTLKKVFTEVGLLVTTLQKPEDTIKILKEEDFDIIILDVCMPEMSGFEVCHNIRNEKIDTPIIFLTSENSINNKVKGLEIGANDYIIKPFDVDELTVRVMKVVRNEIAHKEDIYLDKITQAYTERLFKINYRIAINRHLRDEEVFSVCMIDIDNFKKVNETYGYERGNKILKKFTEKLKNELRVTDQIYRYVGDKFIILFAATKPEKAYKIIESFRRELMKNPMEITGEKPIPITISAGVVGINMDNENALEMIENVKGALLISKQKGKNRSNLRKENITTLIVPKEENKVKVLIIDDNMSIVYVIKKHLESLNYEVEIAGNGEKGLFKASVFVPDIIIVDILLPNIDGFEVINAIKKDFTFELTKIIVMTSYCKKEYIEKCKMIGVKDFLVKPFGMKELENRMEKLLMENLDEME